MRDIHCKHSNHNTITHHNHNKLMADVMSMWSLGWCFTTKHLTILRVTICHTAGHYGEEYEDWNSAIFRSLWNHGSDGDEETDGGRAFHARAAVTQRCGLIPADLSAEKWLKVESTTRFENSHVYARWLNKKARLLLPKGPVLETNVFAT